MRKIRCLIVDDEPLALDLIEGYVKKTPFLELSGRCSSAIEALLYLSSYAVDVVFLDIQMPELTGIELSRSLINGPKVIFTTAYEHYAVEGFKVDALHYLLKPFNYEEFLKAAQKAQQWFQLVEAAKPEAGSAPHIFVKADYKLVKIYLDDILFVEGLKDYAKIHLEGNFKPLLCLMTLKSLEEQLPSYQFMRVHRSFIINLGKIDAVERAQVVIQQSYIAIGEQYKDKFQRYVSSKTMNQ